MSSSDTNVDSNSTKAVISPSDTTSTAVPNTRPTGPNRIKCLLDRSGSMGPLFTSLIKGVNDLLMEQRQTAEDLGTEPHIEIWVFDTVLTMVRDGLIKAIDPIQENEVQPRGATALNDAMATILDNGKDDTDVLFFIFTDGQENSSVTHRGDTGRQYCKSLVEMYSRDKNWTVIFGAANIDAYQTGSMYGVTPDNAFNVAADAPTMGNMMRAVSGAVRTASLQGGRVDVSQARQVSAPSRLQADASSPTDGKPHVTFAPELNLKRTNAVPYFEPPAHRSFCAESYIPPPAPSADRLGSSARPLSPDTDMVRTLSMNVSPVLDGTSAPYSPVSSLRLTRSTLARTSARTSSTTTDDFSIPLIPKSD